MTAWIIPLLVSVAPDATSTCVEPAATIAPGICSIACHFNVSKTAQALFIHPNSVLYRLNKVETLLEVDIKDAGVLHSFLFSDRLFQYTGLDS